MSKTPIAAKRINQLDLSLSCLISLFSESNSYLNPSMPVLSCSFSLSRSQYLLKLIAYYNSSSSLCIRSRSLLPSIVVSFMTSGSFLRSLNSLLIILSKSLSWEIATRIIIIPRRALIPPILERAEMSDSGYRLYIVMFYRYRNEYINTASLVFLIFSVTPSLARKRKGSSYFQKGSILRVV